MKTTTKNQVIDLLQWSTQEYEDRLFQTMYNWCQQYGKYPSVIQRLLANSQVNRWFLNEYHKCELEFLKIADVVPNKTTALQNHYKSCTIQVFQVFPSALIENIKSNGEFSKILFMNLPPYYAN